MRRFRRSDRGLSEIVGTLMLVVIVVAAATLLAAFVASYQKQLQTEETFSHNKSLESIEILALSTTVSNGVFTGFNFTIASEYVNPSGILDVYINGDPLLDFAWENVSTNTFGTYNPQTSANDMIVLPFQQVILQTCLNPSCVTRGGTISNSFLPGDAPEPNHYIKFDVFTHLDNDFSRSYLPPTPLPVISELNPSGNNPLTLLDGSSSIQPGGNTSIVNWAWTVSGQGLASSSTNLSSTALQQGGTHVANGALAGGNVYGSDATASFTVPEGFVFGPGDSVALTPGGNFSASTGCGPLSFSELRGVNSTVVAGSTLTVTFAFNTTLSATCSNGTLSLANGGLSLNLTLTASGEECEISPALASLEGQSAYSVTLTVTNSDGLAGTSTVSYQPPA